MTGFRWPLGLSLAAHAIVVALLFLLPAPAPPAAPPPIEGGIEVTFAPALLPPPAPPPAPQPQKPKPSPPPPPVEMQPPPPPPTPPAPIETPPPAPEAAVEVPLPLPPPPKPSVPPLRREPIRRVERPHPIENRPPPAPAVTPSAPAQQALLPPARVVPPRAPTTTVTPAYASLLGTWLNSHKRYPESARERHEEGRAVLRFAVERNGRVSGFSIVKSTGYPDLDAAVADMMRGAVLPAFPADMPEGSVTVSVTIRFSLQQ